MNEDVIQRAMAQLAKADSDIARGLEQVGNPAARQRPPGFETFLSTIISQQISAKVAHVIQQRVLDRMGEPNAQALLALEDQTLRDAGMSFRKIEYAKGMAQAITEGRFDPDHLHELDDDSAIKSITDLRGFGRWSAEIYLMFSLNRADVFPAEDLALQVALGRLKNLPDKPTPARARKLVEHWAPWRSVGALFLWHYHQGAPA